MVRITSTLLLGIRSDSEQFTGDTSTDINSPGYIHSPGYTKQYENKHINIIIINQVEDGWKTNIQHNYNNVVASGLRKTELRCWREWSCQMIGCCQYRDHSRQRIGQFVQGFIIVDLFNASRQDKVTYYVRDQLLMHQIGQGPVKSAWQSRLN